MADETTHDITAGGIDLSARDRRRIEQGMRKHHRILLAWLTKKFGDRELAQDLAQETYLRIWQYAAHHEITHLKALLFKTAANLAANEFRARGRWRGTGELDGAAPAAANVEFIASDAPSPERTAVARAEARASLAAIRQLPERQRRAFVMNRFEGRNYAEIAAALEVSVSSVEKYIMAALTTLRQVSEREPCSPNVVPMSSRRGNGTHDLQ